jgi:hypothetical protein
MTRYHILYTLSQFLCAVAMRFDIRWLFEMSGTLEAYADTFSPNTL